MLLFAKYYLPEIQTFTDNENVTVEVTGLNKNFMWFDASMNKFVFHGVTISNVGRHLVGVKISSVDNPGFFNQYWFTVIVENITDYTVVVNPRDPRYE